MSEPKTVCPDDQVQPQAEAGLGGVAVTPELWKEIADYLDNPYGQVELLCDGQRINAAVVRKTKKTLTYCVAAYIDGWIKGEWIMNPPEHVQKFWNRTEQFVYSKKDRDRAAAYFKQKKRGRSPDLDTYFTHLEKKQVYWDPYWPTAKPLIRQIKKTCTEIRVLRIGVKDYQETTK
jgi:hypothetical protein